MTSAKLLSAIEPVILLPAHAASAAAKPAAPVRPATIWACNRRRMCCIGWSIFGPPAKPAPPSALPPHGCSTNSIRSRREKDQILAETESRAEPGPDEALAKVQRDALEYLQLRRSRPGKPTPARLAELEADPLVQFALDDSLANVYCPACKLWNTGHGATMMREAVSLMGGYGVTEDCPGFLGQKWMDAQLEATYEGPEAVQRRQLSITMTNELFLAQFRSWIQELRSRHAISPGTGACTLASAMELWLWTLNHLQTARTRTAKLYQSARQGVTFPLADALCWLLASRCQILDLLELRDPGTREPVAGRGTRKAWSISSATSATCRPPVPPAKSAASAPNWSTVTDGIRRGPAIAAAPATGRGPRRLGRHHPGHRRFRHGPYGDVTEPGQEHPAKAGPCACFDGTEPFVRLRMSSTVCLTGRAWPRIGRRIR